MPDFLKLAEILGQQIKAALEPLKLQLATQQKQLDALPEVPSVEAIAKAAAELIPAPKDGKDAEVPSVDVIASAVAAQFERRFSDMCLSWERQARDSFEKAIDRMPVPKDGQDGLPADAINIEQNEREITITVGDTVKTIFLDTILDRGVWKEGDYEKGDAVTYGGSLWIAQEATTDAPSTSKAWRLAVKKGRDGKDLRDNASMHDKSKGLSL